MRKQRAFAQLTDAEVEQISQSLRSETYEKVLERVCKPRPEGFGLKISIKPLQVLREKRERVDNINRRIKEGQPLTLAEFDAIQAGERQNITDEVHRAIMDSAYEQATSGENSPSDLLKLQTVADFEARAELRAQKAELELRKDQRAANSAEFRKEMAEKRLALAERAQTFRERIAEAKLNEPASSQNSALRNPKSAIKEDALGRLARNLDDVERRVCAQFNLPYDGPSPEPSSQPSSSPEPSGSLECGGSTPLSAAPELPARSDPQPATSNSQPISGSSQREEALESKRPYSDGAETAATTPPTNASASPAVNNLNQQPATSNLQPTTTIPEKTKSHAIRRWRAHIRRPAGTPEPDGSWRDECPCGNQAPCAEHPELKTRVRAYRPQLPDYMQGLQEFNVPYYKPTAEEIGCTQEELDKSCNPFAYNPQMKDAPDPRFAPDWLRPSP